MIKIVLSDEITPHTLFMQANLRFKNGLKDPYCCTCLCLSQPNCLWDLGIFNFFIYLDKEAGAVLVLVAGIALLMHVPLRRLLWKAGGTCWSFQSGSVSLRRAGSETS